MDCNGCVWALQLAPGFLPDSELGRSTAWLWYLSLRPADGFDGRTRALLHALCLPCVAAPLRPVPGALRRRRRRRSAAAPAAAAPAAAPAGAMACTAASIAAPGARPASAWGSASRACACARPSAPGAGSASRWTRRWSGGWRLGTALRAWGLIWRAWAQVLQAAGHGTDPAAGARAPGDDHHRGGRHWRLWLAR